MKEHRSRALLAFLFLAAGCSADISQDGQAAAGSDLAPAGERPVGQAGAPIVIGEAFDLPSDVFSGTRRVSIRLPVEYADAEGTSFPVVYMLDGGPEQDFPHIAGLAQSREMNLTFGPFILVGVETVNRRSEITPPVVDAAPYEQWLGATPGGSAGFRRHIRDEVMPFVEGRFRTDGRSVVIGESLAGLFVVETLFDEPALFDDYVAISPSLWWEDMKLPREALERLGAMPAGDRRLYLSMADEGVLMQKGMDLLVDALNAGAPASLQWAYIYLGESETHASVYHGAALDAFRLLFPEPTRLYRATPLISGTPETPLTPEQTRRREEECTVQSAIPGPPADTRANDDRHAYECRLYDYGYVATRGEWRAGAATAP